MSTLEINENIQLNSVTLDISAGTLTLADDQISGNKITGGTIGSITISQLAGVMDCNSQAMTNINVDSGAIDGCNITVGADKTLDISAGTLTLANDQISGDKITGGTIGSITISQLAGAMDCNSQAMTNINVDSGAIDGCNITVGADKTLDVSAGTLTTANGIESLTTAEVDQLENIGTTTISAGQWGYLGGMNQDVITTSDVVFNSLSLIDSKYIKIGTGNDLQLYHDASNSYISNATGDLIIQTDGSGTGIILDTEDDTL